MIRCQHVVRHVRIGEETTVQFPTLPVGEGRERGKGDATVFSSPVLLAVWSLAHIAGVVAALGAASAAEIPNDSAAGAGKDAGVIRYVGDGSDLQQVIDDAPARATIRCDPGCQLELTAPVTLNKALTLKGLNARLPERLARTSLIVVEAEGVTIADVELHGNFDSVHQDERAPLIAIHAGDFRLERCKFFDGSKDGVEVAPRRDGKDIVGGVSGGNRGLRVRDVTVENVRLEKGYFRGAVEVSDGTDRITVRNVYAEACVYAIDVQDHGTGSAPNTNVHIENVEAVDCRHIIRTANRDLGHAHLTLRKITGKNCAAPVQISNTKQVTIEGLAILEHRGNSPPIVLTNCHGVRLKNVTVESAQFADQPVKSSKCSEVDVDGLEGKQRIDAPDR